MITPTTFKSMPRRDILINLSWLAALVILGLGILLPVQRSSVITTREIQSAKGKIEVQKQLQPLYQMLLAKSRAPSASVLPTPASGRLSRAMINAVPFTIKKIAAAAAMDAFSVSTDIGSLANQSRFLQVHAVVRGNFTNFRRFLVGIGELPYLERVESIEIQQDPDIMEFRIKIWLALSD